MSAPFNVEKLLQEMGGRDAFEDMVDRDHGWPSGAAKKMFAMSREYEDTLRLWMRLYPSAKRSWLRLNMLPLMVKDIFKDWSPLKQEYLVWAGVKIWFNERRSSVFNDIKDDYWVWEGFHEHCTKWVHKQGFPSGKGDRELFGWTVEQGDEHSHPDENVYWSEDEEEKTVDDKDSYSKGKGKEEQEGNRSSTKCTATEDNDETRPSKKAGASM